MEVTTKFIYLGIVTIIWILIITNSKTGWVQLIATGVAFFLIAPAIRRERNVINR